MVNQLLIHIGTAPTAYCKEQNRVAEASSPFVHGKPLNAKHFAGMAQKRGVSVPQLYCKSSGSQPQRGIKNEPLEGIRMVCRLHFLDSPLGVLYSPQIPKAAEHGHREAASIIKSHSSG